MNWSSKALFSAIFLLLISLGNSNPLLSTTTCCINGAVTCNDEELPDQDVLMMEADRGIDKAFSWIDRDDLVTKFRGVEQICGYAKDSKFNPHVEIYLWTKANCGGKVQCYRYDIQDCSESSTLVTFPLDEAHVFEDGCSKFEQWSKTSGESDESSESKSGDDESNAEDESKDSGAASADDGSDDEDKGDVEDNENDSGDDGDDAGDDANDENVEQRADDEVRSI